jgi:four helix bundle protein
MQDFRNLKVWRKAHALVLQVYAKTAYMPKEEVFGLTAQIRRAAASAAANIAEGSSRTGDKEFGRFLQVARASVTEVEYFAILISDLEMLKKARTAEIESAAVEVRRMLSGLLATLPQSHDCKVIENHHGRD